MDNTTALWLHHRHIDDNLFRISVPADTDLRLSSGLGPGSGSHTSSFWTCLGFSSTACLFHSFLVSYLAFVFLVRSVLFLHWLSERSDCFFKMALCRGHLHGEYLRVVWAISRSASRRPFACLVFFFFSCGFEAALLVVPRVLCTFYVFRSVTSSPVEDWGLGSTWGICIRVLWGTIPGVWEGAGIQDDNASTARCNLAMGLILFGAVLFYFCAFCLSGVWLSQFLLTITSFLLLVLVILFPQPCLDFISLRHYINTPLGNAYSESSGRLPWPNFGPKVG